MSRSRLEPMARLITRDIISVIKSRKNSYRKKLPGRKMLYIWDDRISRDPFNDIDVPGFVVRLRVIQEDGSIPSIDAEAGEEDGDVLIWINITFDASNKRHFSTLYHELRGVLRHEIEHISELGPLTMVGPYQREVYGENIPSSGKILHSINRRMKIFGAPGMTRAEWAALEMSRVERAREGKFLEYVTSFDELGPFVAGFMTQARTSRSHFDDVVLEYLDNFVERNSLSHAERDEAVKWLNAWALDRYPRVRLRQKLVHN